MWQDLAITDLIYFQWIPVPVFNQIVDMENVVGHGHMENGLSEFNYLAIIFFNFGRVDAYISNVEIYKICNPKLPSSIPAGGKDFPWARKFNHIGSMLQVSPPEYEPEPDKQ